MGGLTSTWCRKCWRQMNAGDVACRGCGTTLPAPGAEAVLPVQPAPLPPQPVPPPALPVPPTARPAWPATQPVASAWPVAQPGAQPATATWAPAPPVVQWDASGWPLVPPPAPPGDAALPSAPPSALPSALPSVPPSALPSAPPSAPPDADAERPRGPRAWTHAHRILVPAIVVALAVVVAGVVLMLRPGAGIMAADQASEAGAGSAPAGGDPVHGSLTSHATATAPATSPSAVDGAGRPVSYQASHMLDGDATSAWRMDGNGTGAVLTFTLDRSRPITTLGLINGYAKTDPATGDDRYRQGRRITHVTWTVGGRTIPQSLADGPRALQTVSFPAVTASTVRLRIDAVTAPGSRSFDKTAISEVVIANR